MTLAEMLYTLKHDNGGDFEVYINRGYDLPTFDYSTLCNTVDEWIQGFVDGDVWWSNRDNDDEDGTIEERREWEIRLLMSPVKLMEETGPYDEPSGQWIDVDDSVMF